MFLNEAVALERIAALTTTARTTWLVLLGFLAFIGLTLLSVRDVDFFSISATTDLPIVNIAILTTTFFWTAALLAAVLHTYFHVFLLKLWDALAEAPAEIDRLKLGDRVFPWLVNDWALRRRTGRPVTERPMDWLADSVTFLVIWLAAPIALAGFWWRSMPAHDVWLTLTIAVALAVSFYASFHGWRRATARMRQPGPIGGCNDAGQPIATGWRPCALIAAIVLVVISALRTEIGAIRMGPFQSESFLLARADIIGAEIAIEPVDWRDPEIARRRFHVQWCDNAGIPEHACEAPEHPDQELARQRWCDGLDIENCAERFREIDAAFADEWTIERKAAVDNIRGPDLRGRDLRSADASGAFLAGVDLREARLEGADLSWARLEGANLSWAGLQSAEWAGATFSPSPAHWADFTDGKNLTQSQLEVVIGDDMTILPRDAQTGEALHVWSCWEEDAAASFIEIWSRHHEDSAETLWNWIVEHGWICGPDNPRRPVGTPAEDVVGGYR